MIQPCLLFILFYFIFLNNLSIAELNLSEKDRLVAFSTFFIFIFIYF